MNFIQMHSGTPFDPLSFGEDSINIFDIGWSLSRICRFNGHVHCEHYSVAQHSVLVSENLPHHLQAWGLLHDAAEMVMGDILPVYKDLFVGLRQLENRILKVIAERFNLVWPIPSQVKRIDTVLLATEKRDLMLPSQRPWQALPEPLKQVINPLPAKDAYAQWMARAVQQELI